MDTALSMPLDVSTADDPGLANSLTQQALAQATTPMAQIKEPPKTHFTLPGGYVDPQGRLVTDVEVRELTGADEEALARVDVAKQPSKYLETLVMRGVVTIGGMPMDLGIHGSLLIGDREAIVMFLRQVTFGNDLPMKTRCPACLFEADMVIELDQDVPAKTMEDPLKRVLTLDLRVGTIEIALVTALVAAAVQDTPGKTSAELNTLVLQRCVKTINGQPASAQDVLNLPAADRKALLEAINDAQPGPRYGEVSITCTNCGKESPLPLTLDDLFR